MEATLCAVIRDEFAQLGAQLEAQLRREVREEMHSASKARPDAPFSPRTEAAGGMPPSSYEPHGWTKRHLRRHHTSQYVQEMEDPGDGIRHGRSARGAFDSLPTDKVVVARRGAAGAARNQLVPPGAAAGGADVDTALRRGASNPRNPGQQMGPYVKGAGPSAVSPHDSPTSHIDAWTSKKISSSSGSKRFRSNRNDAVTGMTRNALDLAGDDEDSVDHESRPRNLASKVVQSAIFEHVVILLILANCVTVGCQINHMATNLLASPPAGFRTADLLFCLCFLLELLLRLYVHRGRFFYMWGWGWNLMDLALVAANIVEEALLLYRSVPSSLVLRTVRVFRSVRIVRVLRVMRYAEDLRLLVTCILCSAKAFIWAVLLLLFTIYGFGAYITQSVHIHRIEHVDQPDGGSEELAKWYGSVPLTVLSLFQALTGGVDWNDIVRPLMDNMHSGWGLMTMMWVAFSVLAVMNIITGTFVQSAIERSRAIKEMDKVTLAHKIFSLLDENSNGVISKKELVEHLDTEQVQDFFRSIDVDTSEAICLFDLLDCSGDGRIDFEEFLSGIVRLQGNAKALDMILLILDTKQGFQQQSAMLNAIYARLTEPGPHEQKA